jgi:hypothetical protein
MRFATPWRKTRRRQLNKKMELAKAPLNQMLDQVKYTNHLLTAALKVLQNVSLSHGLYSCMTEERLMSMINYHLRWAKLRPDSALSRGKSGVMRG